MLTTNTVLSAALAGLLLTALSGCRFHATNDSSMTTTVGGRQITARIDVPAVIETERNAAAVRFGANRVRVESERLVIDGKERARLPASARQVEVKLSRNKLTVTADGAHILTTKLEN